MCDIVTIAYPLDVGVISARLVGADQLERVSFTRRELQQILVEVTLAVVDSIQVPVGRTLPRQ